VRWRTSTYVDVRQS